MSETRPTRPAAPLPPDDERLWSALAHVGNVLGPVPSLLILLLLGPRSTRVRREATEALNLAVTAVIAWAALWVVGAVVGVLTDAAPFGVGALLGLLTLLVGLAQFAVWVLVVVLSIVAAVRVSSGGSFRYPLSLRLVH